MLTDCIDISTQLESWYARQSGQYLLQSTRTAVQEMLDTSFGYHILQLGVSGGDHPLSHLSPINHRLFSAQSMREGVDLVARPDELPLDSDSVDTIIIHHCLEFAHNPHQVLREVQRVLTPQGRLLIIGFNPYSLMGLNVAARAVMRDPLWRQHRPLSEKRLTDWLHLLGCEVLDTLHLYCLPPTGKGRWRQWMTACDSWTSRHNFPVGGLYVLHATKNVAGLHQTRRRRFAGSERLIALVPKPAHGPTAAPNTATQKSLVSFEKKSISD
jgi:ubiquinone/menaquinone biosynthesis C-methylase UbiE